MMCVPVCESECACTILLCIWRWGHQHSHFSLELVHEICGVLSPPPILLPERQDQRRALRNLALWGQGIWTQVFMLELQALYPLSHCSSPYNFASVSHIAQRLSPLGLAISLTFYHCSHHCLYQNCSHFHGWVLCYCVADHVWLFAPSVVDLSGSYLWMLWLSLLWTLMERYLKPILKWIWGTHGHCIFNFLKSPRINL